MKNMLEIVAVIDRSGSTDSVKTDFVGAFNGYLDKQKREPGEKRLTQVHFDGPIGWQVRPLYFHIDSKRDDTYIVLHDAKPLGEVPHLNLNDPPDRQTFVPRGSTQLHDAIGRTIDAVGKRLHNTPEWDRPNRVLFIVLTDGFENTSVLYNASMIRSMIEHQTQKYGWQFLFMGADQDAVLAGGAYGIAAAACVSTVASGAGNRAMGDTLSHITSNYCNTGEMVADAQVFYAASLAKEEKES